ncbi:helical backbone metal receptor, partial [Vibrio parahaemolyticus]
MNKICLYLPLFFSSLTMANEPVERVISLAPHATEIAYAAGLGDKLIAVSEMSDYPKEAGELEKVSNYQGIKLERIIALQPDLVIAWPAGNPAKELEKLKQFGVPIYYSTTGTLEDIANNIEQLSQYSDDPSKGQKAARDFREGLTALKATYNTTEKVRYFYQLSEKPIITVAGKNWPSE